MIVVSDTGPICYLTLIGHVGELATLYGRVLIPTAVVDDLSDSRTPAQVRAWITSPPDWLEVVRVTVAKERAESSDLGRGELEAITLAEQRGADRPRGAAGGGTTRPQRCGDLARPDRSTRARPTGRAGRIDPIARHELSRFSAVVRRGVGRHAGAFVSRQITAPGRSGR